MGIREGLKTRRKKLLTSNSDERGCSSGVIKLRDRRTRGYISEGVCVTLNRNTFVMQIRINIIFASSSISSSSASSSSLSVIAGVSLSRPGTFMNLIF